MRSIWRKIVCALFHCWWHRPLTDWQPVDFADWQQAWHCDRCHDTWVEIR